MAIKRSDGKGFTIYFETADDVKRFESFIQDLIEGVKRVHGLEKQV